MRPSAGATTVWRHFRRQAPVALAAALTALLVILALLQQSWLAKVSEAERGRARAHVDSAAAAFSRDFNEPLSRLAFDFLPALEAPGEAPDPASSLGASLARRLERWRATSAEPDLLAALWLAEREPDRVRFRRLDESSRTLLPPAAPPPALENLAGRIAELPAEGDSVFPRRRPGAAAIEMLDETIPALILPLPGSLQGLLPDVIAFAPTDHPERRPLAEALHWRMAVRGAGRWLVLQLDRQVIEQRILPLLAERHFNGDAFGLRVVAKADPGEPIFTAGRPMPQDATIERSVDLFGPLVFARGLRPPGRPFEVPLPAPEAPAPPEPPPPPEPPAVPPEVVAPFEPVEQAPRSAPSAPPAPPERRDPRPSTAPPAAPLPPAPLAARVAASPPSPFGVFFSRSEGPAGPFELGEGRWRLEVFHQEGSLDAAIDRAQQRNLTLALGILVVLGASMLFLAGAARKAQALARRQLELVAGVTHELLTPLAAMKSAGQNLRDGVVQEAPKVSRYGELIVKESDRLSGLVGQVLSWAGLESQATATRRERVDPVQASREALDDLRPGLETANFEVVFEAQADLPPVWADPAALRQALGNLIANAIKYGKPAEGRPYLRVAVDRERGGRRVAFTVADRGPGIAAEDLPHIFEPFYRGRRVVASNLAGAGLGLALVRRIAENHGGELALSQSGGGASFTLVLPVEES